MWTRRHLQFTALLILAAATSPVRPLAAQATFPTGDFAHQVLDGETMPDEFAGMTFRITSEGDLLVLAGQEVVGRYGYRVDGDHFQLWSAGPGMDCMFPELIVGEYKWWLENGAIRFQPIDDACPGRADIAAVARFKKVN